MQRKRAGHPTPAFAPGQGSGLDYDTQSGLPTGPGRRTDVAVADVLDAADHGGDLGKVDPCAVYLVLGVLSANEVQETGAVQVAEVTGPVDDPGLSVVTEGNKCLSTLVCPGDDPDGLGSYSADQDLACFSGWHGPKHRVDDMHGRVVDGPPDRHDGAHSAGIPGATVQVGDVNAAFGRATLTTHGGGRRGPGHRRVLVPFEEDEDRRDTGENLTRRPRVDDTRRLDRIEERGGAASELVQVGQGEVGPDVHNRNQGHHLLNRSRRHDRYAAVRPGDTPGSQPGRCAVHSGARDTSTVHSDRDDGTAARDERVTDGLSRHDPAPSSEGAPMYARCCVP